MFSGESDYFFLRLLTKNISRPENKWRPFTDPVFELDFSSQGYLPFSAGCGSWERFFSFWGVYSTCCRAKSIRWMGSLQHQWDACAGAVSVGSHINRKVKPSYYRLELVIIHVKYRCIAFFIYHDQNRKISIIKIVIFFRPSIHKNRCILYVFYAQYSFLFVFDSGNQSQRNKANKIRWILTR